MVNCSLNVEAINSIKQGAWKEPVIHGSESGGTYDYFNMAAWDSRSSYSKYVKHQNILDSAFLLQRLPTCSCPNWCEAAMVQVNQS